MIWFTQFLFLACKSFSKKNSKSMEISLFFSKWNESKGWKQPFNADLLVSRHGSLSVQVGAIRFAIVHGRSWKGA